MTDFFDEHMTPQKNIIQEYKKWVN